MSLSTDYYSAQNQTNTPLLDAADINLDHLDSDARTVLDFWFDKKNEPYWFVKNDDFDQQIDDKFGKIWQAARQGECAPWRRINGQVAIDNSRTELAGRLAEIIVLDQFSRNLFREQGLAFAQDDMALALAQEAIHQPQFRTLPMQWRKFIIMPFMHSESTVIHKRYLKLFEQLNDAETLDFEHKHLAIIEQFGRYPQRNQALDRESTTAEKEFLQQSDLSF